MRFIVLAGVGHLMVLYHVASAVTLRVLYRSFDRILLSTRAWVRLPSAFPFATFSSCYCQKAQAL